MMEKISLKLRSAIISDNANEVKKLLAKGAKANEKSPIDFDNDTPMHLAAKYKNPHIIFYLFKSLNKNEINNAVDDKNIYNFTPIHELLTIGKKPKKEDKEEMEKYNRKVMAIPFVFNFFLKESTPNLNTVCDFNKDKEELQRFSVIELLEHQLKYNKDFELVNCVENSALTKCIAMITSRGKTRERHEIAKTQVEKKPTIKFNNRNH